MPEGARRKPGRRPGGNQTRQAIITAARARFAEAGFEPASVRSIARDADVDPALVIHFFGSKAELFAEATALPFDPDDVRRRVASGPRSQMGVRLAAFFLSIWDDDDLRERIMALLRSAATSAQGAELLRGALQRQLLQPLGEHLDAADAPLRMSLCASQLVGLGITRYIVAIAPLASLEPEAVVKLVGPGLQRYLTGKLAT